MQQQTNANRPMIGDKVLVNWKTDGECHAVKCKDVDYVSAVYLDGTVRIGNGDVYAIEASTDDKARWQTVKPRTDKRGNIL